MTELTLSTDAAQGTYRTTHVTDLERSVHVGCPACGTIQLLRDVHISPEGDVRPTFTCACGFQDALRLAAWKTLRPQFPTAGRRGGNPTV